VKQKVWWIILVCLLFLSACGPDPRVFEPHSYPATATPKPGRSVWPGCPGCF
jgi:hypothetical protein